MLNQQVNAPADAFTIHMTGALYAHIRPEDQPTFPMICLCPIKACRVPERISARRSMPLFLTYLMSPEKS